MSLRAGIQFPVWRIDLLWAGMRSDNALHKSLYQLSRLLSAGMDVSTAIEHVRLLTVNRYWRALWADTGRLVARGNSLAEAVDASAVGVCDSAIALIRAGEASGDLPGSTRQASEWLAWQMEVKREFQRVAIYPMFAVSGLAIVLWYWLLAVIPMVKPHILSGEAVVNWPVQLMFDMSDVLTAHANKILLLIVALVFSIAVTIRLSESLRRLCDAAILQIPLIGVLILQLNLSRYTAILGQLYTYRIDLDHAMRLSEQAIGNNALRQELHDARLRFNNGCSLDEAFSRSCNIPAELVSMVKLGLTTGCLGETLRYSSEHQFQSARQTLEHIQRMTAPALLTVVGAMLIWIILSVFIPAYEVALDRVVHP